MILTHVSLLGHGDIHSLISIHVVFCSPLQDLRQADKRPRMGSEDAHIKRGRKPYIRVVPYEPWSYVPRGPFIILQLHPCSDSHHLCWTRPQPEELPSLRRLKGTSAGYALGVVLRRRQTTGVPSIWPVEIGCEPYDTTSFFVLFKR